MAVRCDECDGLCELEGPSDDGGVVARCLECGYRFDISRGAYDRWLVVTPTGEELLFGSLLELKGAIDERMRTPPPSRLRDDRAHARHSGMPPRRVLPSVPPLSLEGTPAPTKAYIVPLAPSNAPSDDLRDAPRDAQVDEDDRSQDVTAIAESDGYLPVREQSGSDRLRSTPPYSTPPPPLRSRPPPLSGAPRTPSLRPAAARSLSPRHSGPYSSAFPPPTRPVRRNETGAPDMSEAMRFADRVASQPPRVRSLRPEGVGDKIGWGLPVALLAALGAVGYVLFASDPVARSSVTATTASSAATGVTKVDQLLLDGELALSEGNFESASEAFVRASALSERNPRVLLDAARLAVARADIAWLRLRALPADAADERSAARQALSDLTWKAREATEAALAVSPSDPAVVRVKVDTLRIAGEVEVARGLVPRVVAGLAAEPETAYVLAALDLAQSGPVPSTVVDRLHIAALGEGGLGRARALLVYALARSGDVAGAQRELLALQSAPRPHPAAPSLAALVSPRADRKNDAHAAPSQTATQQVGTQQAAPQQGSPQAQQTPEPLAPAANPGPLAAAPLVAASFAAAPKESANDVAKDPAKDPAKDSASAKDSAKNLPPQELLKRANDARHSGDYAKARGLYVAALSRNPGDSEALTGLGDTSRAEGDSTGAASFYKSAIAVNPNYMPSLLGLADLLWDGGDRAEAQRRYAEVVQRFPPTIVPDRARTRAQ